MNQNGDDIQNYFSWYCPICFGQTNCHILTKCGHSFCSDCIRTTKLICALCRKTSESSLPNFAMNDFLDLWKQSCRDDELSIQDNIKTELIFLEWHSRRKLIISKLEDLIISTMSNAIRKNDQILTSHRFKLTFYEHHFSFIKSEQEKHSFIVYFLKIIKKSWNKNDFIIKIEKIEKAKQIRDEVCIHVKFNDNKIVK